MRLYLPGLHRLHGHQGLPHGEPDRGRSEDRAHRRSSRSQGTFVPASVGGYSTTPTPFPGMERATATTRNSRLRCGHVPSRAPRGPLRPGLGCIRQWQDGHPHRLRPVLQPRLHARSRRTRPATRPTPINRAVYYSTLDKIPSFANTAGITPIAPDGTVGNQKVQGTYNGSFMIQQKVGFGTVLEAAYVFNLSKHLPDRAPTQRGPHVLAVQPRQQQPERGLPARRTPAAKRSTTIISVRCRAWALSRTVDFAGNASYNSLQVTVRRNFTRRLSYGLAYTWSKTMSASAHRHGYPYTNTQSPYFTDKFRNYGPSYQPTPHVIVANYIYDVPNLGEKFNVKPLGWVTDHWTISGITQWRSDIRVGVPAISFSGTTSTNPQMNWTGGYEGAQNAGGRQPAASVRPGVVRRQHAAGAGSRRQRQRHARQSAPQRSRLRDSESRAVGRPGPRRNKASDNPCRASATPAPAA